MSAPSHYSTKPTAEEERQVREIEERSKRGPPLQLCSSFFGRKKCPSCGRSLQTWKAQSRSQDSIVYCCDFHSYRLYIENGTKRYEEIARTDPRYDLNKAQAASKR